MYDLHDQNQSVYNDGSSARDFPRVGSSWHTGIRLFLRNILLPEKFASTVDYLYGIDTCIDRNLSDVCGVLFAVSRRKGSARNRILAGVLSYLLCMRIVGVPLTCPDECSRGQAVPYCTVFRARQHFLVG